MIGRKKLSEIRAELNAALGGVRVGEGTSGRPRKLLAVLGCLAATGVGYGAFQVLDGRRGEEKTQALLAGDSNVSLRHLQIEHQQRRLVCTDPEVLRYLEERFRAHEPEPRYLGTSYSMALSYADGGSQTFAAYLTDDGDFNFFLGEPGEGGRGHGIRLPRPRPRGVDELVAFLHKPHEEVAGEVLILEAGGSRVEWDGSLVVR